MMAALVGSMMDDRLGPGPVVVRSAGFGPPDMPAIADVVTAMERRGLDVSQHRSRPAHAEIVRSADLVLTAEQDHVIRIAAIDPAAFPRTMTLPEFISAASRSLPDHEEDATDWVQRLTAARTPQSYLDDRIGEIEDPTGSPARAFEDAVVALEAQCSMVAILLTRALVPAL